MLPYEATIRTTIGTPFLLGSLIMQTSCRSIGATIYHAFLLLRTGCPGQGADRVPASGCQGDVPNNNTFLTCSEFNASLGVFFLGFILVAWNGHEVVFCWHQLKCPLWLPGLCSLDL